MPNKTTFLLDEMAKNKWRLRVKIEVEFQKKGDAMIESLLKYIFVVIPLAHSHLSLQERSRASRG